MVSDRLDIRRSCCRCQVFVRREKVRRKKDKPAHLSVDLFPLIVTSDDGLACGDRNSQSVDIIDRHTPYSILLASWSVSILEEHALL
jgi:hypothetical protein